MTQISLKPDTVNSCPGNLPERIAVMAGTFDPFTIGHKSIVDRGLELFDRIVICVGVNAAKLAENPALAVSAETRADNIRRIFAGCPRVEVVASAELTVDVARRFGARFLLRGVRSVRDFEYERDMADLNFRLASLESVFLVAHPEMACISSSAVRDIASHGADVSGFMP